MTVSQVLYSRTSPFSLHPCETNVDYHWFIDKEIECQRSLVTCPGPLHLLSSLHGELSHSKLVGFPLTTTTFLDSGPCSDVLRDTHPEHSKIPTSPISHFYSLILLYFPS